MKNNNESIFQQRYILMHYCKNESTIIIVNKRFDMSDISYRFIYVESSMFPSETHGFAISLQCINKYLYHE